MRAEYRVTEQDYVDAVREETWRSLAERPSARRLGLWAVLAAVFGFALVFDPTAGAIAVLAALVLIVVVLGVDVIFAPRRSRRLYRQYKGLHDPMTVELLDGGIRLTSADGESMLKWPNIWKWDQSRNFVFIYPMPQIFHVVPKSVAGGGFDMALLVARLQEQVGPARVARR